MNSLGLDLIKNLNKKHVSINEDNNTIIPNKEIIDTSNEIQKKSEIPIAENSIDIKDETNKTIITTSKNTIEESSKENSKIIVPKENIVKSEINQQENKQNENKSDISPYKRFIPSMHTLVFVAVLSIIMFIVYKYFNNYNKMFETKLDEMNQKMKLFHQ